MDNNRKTQGPNIIGNEENQPNFMDRGPFNLNKTLQNYANATEEEKKAPVQVKAVTLAQFTRNINSKEELLNALETKGKFVYDFSYFYFFRSTLPSRKKALQDGVRKRHTFGKKELLYLQLGTQSFGPPFQIVVHEDDTCLRS